MATGTMPPQTFWFALALLTIIIFSRSSTALPSENLNSREAAHPDKRQWTSRGIQIIPGKCTGPQLTAMKNAILDASYLAGAGINAAADFDNVPFSYFFKSDYATGNTVAGVLQRAMHSQQGQGDLIGATCEDVYNYCSPNGRAQPAYSVQVPGTGKAAIIVVCPLGLSLKRNLVPCTANPGAISLGWLMLHMMTHITWISGPGLRIDDAKSKTARDVHTSMIDGVDTTKISDPYAHLGSWSWDMGLGGTPWNEQKICKRNFWRGQFDLTGLDAVNPSM